MLYDIPNRYRRTTDFSEPAYLRGFEHFFYANLDEPIDDSDFANWRLSLFDKFGTETASDIGALVKDPITSTTFRFYANFTIPIGTNPGSYQLVVYNSSTSDVKYIANCTKVITDADIEDYVLLFFRNSTNLYNFNYQGFTNYNTIFLPLNVVEQQPEIQLDQVTEASSGIIRNRKTQASKVVTLESFFFDDEANNMMLALSVHNDILVNNSVMTVRTAFQIDTNRFNPVQKGTIELYDQSFSTINLNT